MRNPQPDTGSNFRWPLRARPTLGIVALGLALAHAPCSAGSSIAMCNGTGLMIPDNDPNGVASTITISGSGATVGDLNVRVLATHPWIGDLKLKLRHIASGTTASIVDRPGVPATPSGCQGDDLSYLVLDDEASYAVETSCLNFLPAYPSNANRTPNQLLSAFAGESADGIWELRASDHAVNDVGTLDYWCVAVNDDVFRDGFEAGNFAAWSAAETDGGDLSVSTAAALNGDFGLRAVIDDTNPIYLVDATPDDDSYYKVRFYLDPNGFTVGPGGERVKIFQALAEGPVARLVTVVLRRQNGEYKLLAKAHQEDGSWVNTGFATISDGRHFVEVHWGRAEVAGGFGELKLHVDGAFVAAVSADNFALGGADFARLGLLGVPAGAAGAIYLDAFESTRRLYIGAED